MQAVVTAAYGAWAGRAVSEVLGIAPAEVVLMAQCAETPRFVRTNPRSGPALSPSVRWTRTLHGQAPMASPHPVQLNPLAVWNRPTYLHLVLRPRRCWLHRMRQGCCPPKPPPSAHSRSGADQPFPTSTPSAQHCNPHLVHSIPSAYLRDQWQ